METFYALNTSDWFWYLRFNAPDSEEDLWMLRLLRLLTPQTANDGPVVVKAHKSTLTLWFLFICISFDGEFQ